MTSWVNTLQFFGVEYQGFGDSLYILINCRLLWLSKVALRPIGLIPRHLLNKTYQGFGETLVP